MEVKAPRPPGNLQKRSAASVKIKSAKKHRTLRALIHPVCIHGSLFSLSKLHCLCI